MDLHAFKMYVSFLSKYKTNSVLRAFFSKLVKIVSEVLIRFPKSLITLEPAGK